MQKQYPNHTFHEHLLSTTIAPRVSPSLFYSSLPSPVATFNAFSFLLSFSIYYIPTMFLYIAYRRVIILSLNFTLHIHSYSRKCRPNLDSIEKGRQKGRKERRNEGIKEGRKQGKKGGRDGERRVREVGGSNGGMERGRYFQVIQKLGLAGRNQYISCLPSVQPEWVSGKMPETHSVAL